MQRLLLLLAFILCRSAAADFTTAKEAYDREDYETAAEEFRRLADQGNGDAAWYLGDMYDNGKGVSEDDVRAAEWWLKAAESGHAQSAWELVLMYHTGGAGVPSDKCKAARWARRAAELGHPKAREYAEWRKTEVVCRERRLIEFTVAGISGEQMCERLRYWFGNFLDPDYVKLFAEEDPGWLEALFGPRCASAEGMMVQVPFIGDSSKLTLAFVVTMSRAGDHSVRVLLSNTVEDEGEEVAASKFNLELVEQHLRTGITPSEALMR